MINRLFVKIMGILIDNENNHSLQPQIGKTIYIYWDTEITSNKSGSFYLHSPTFYLQFFKADKETSSMTKHNPFSLSLCLYLSLSVSLCLSQGRQTRNKCIDRVDSSGTCRITIGKNRITALGHVQFKEREREYYSRSV